MCRRGRTFDDVHGDVRIRVHGDGREWPDVPVRRMERWAVQWMRAERLRDGIHAGSWVHNQWMPRRELSRDDVQCCMRHGILRTAEWIQGVPDRVVAGPRVHDVQSVPMYGCVHAD